MPASNHKALDRNDQSSKRLTLNKYTKGSMRRKETTDHEKTEPKFETRNKLPSPQSILEENTIQIWSGKHGEWESHQTHEQQ